MTKIESSVGVLSMHENMKDLEQRQPRLHSALNKLERSLGYRWQRRELLRTALTHRSSDVGAANERLEFLGDAVLGLVVSLALSELFPDADEGWLSRTRSQLVSAPALAELARELGVGPCLLLGTCEEKSGGRDKDNLLADAMEAIVAALFVEAGFEKTRAVLEPLIVAEIPAAAEKRQDFKTKLQEFTQAKFRLTPEYELIGAVGPDHAKLFSIEVRLDGKPQGNGTGASKKLAAQQAARQALIALGGMEEAKEHA
jgi:ribonuclease-3